MNRLARTLGGLFDRLDQNYVLYIVVVLLAMFSLGQLTSPFIAHDDFDWLLSGFDQGFETPFSKALSEGRWGNVIWAKFSHFLSIKAAFGLYLVAFSAMCVGLSRALHRSAGVLGAVLIFLSPMTAETMQWPVTQVTGVAVTLIGILAMMRVQSDGHRRLVMAIGVVAGFLFYPSFGPLFLLVYAVQSAGSKRSVILGAVVYVMSFVAAVLLVFSLNYVFHGTFSIKPATWRQATPLLQGGSLIGNVERYLTWYALVKELWPALLAGSVGYAACLFLRIRLRQCLSALLLAGLLWGIDASLSIVSGLSLPLRSTVWLWLLVCIPVIFLVYERRTFILGLVLCLPLAYTGATGWISAYSGTRHVYPAMEQIGLEIARVQGANAGKFDDVILFGDVHANPTTGWVHSNRALRNYLFKDFGLYTMPCDEDLCAKIQSDVDQRGEVPQWLIVDRHLVWVLSAQNTSTY
ncbi:hypothetical protein [Stenotrophomonas sp.]|uniref:hypothetical protein n=1 Tax=Stenotrophomonas sp. TaxID=69392 RepID=UPI0028A94D02|nr:hypothetical protein [Stenotrophomonas sp.]